MKILIINPFGIGDVLFTTPLIRAIKENYPRSFLGYWCNERVEPILKNNPFVDKTFALSRGDLKRIFQKSKIEGIKKALGMFFGIKNYNFDMTIDFSLDHRYGLVSKLAGIKKRVGFNYKNRGRFLTDKINLDGYRDKHVVEYYLDILGYLEIPKPKAVRLELFLDKGSLDWAENFFEEYNLKKIKPLIGIAPCGGASWGRQAHFKYWPLENYIELIKRLITQCNTEIILFADREEKENINSMEEILEGRVINLAGKLSTLQYLSLLSKLDILITNDSGNIHMAVASGIKTVSIFGPVDERVYGPYPIDNHTVIKKDLPCRPCYRDFKFFGCRYDLKCLKDISVDEVYSAVKSLLSK